MDEAITAQALTGDRQKSIAAGMNDYLAKPIDPDRLVAVLTRRVKIPEERHAGAMASQVG